MLEAPQPQVAKRSPADPMVAMRGAEVRELGVPYGQGYFLSRPTRPQLIPDSYAHVAARAAMSSC